MKLFEIIQPTVDQRKIKGNLDHHSRIPAQIVADRAGWDNSDSKYKAGAFSIGKSHTHDPHTFRKSLIYPTANITKKDPYSAYLLSCIPLMKTNPFVPRLYNIKVVTGENGKQLASYDLETLHPLDHISGISLDSIGTRIFKDFPPFSRVERDEEQAKKRTIETICKWAQEATETGNFSSIKDPQFKQAIELIIKVHKQLCQTYKDNYHGIDMHSGNFMIRGTPHGPQLVITDPIA